tara:strand:+ start:106 stop:1626 length:1521 start_codon:yes stop_codon:yes gene_type:complete
MAVIPTFQRQQGLPRSTGMTGLPAVKIDDHIGNALGNHSQTATAIGGKLVEAQAVSEVSTATVSAQLKLAELETKLSKQDGIVANQTFAVEAQTIYDNAASIIATPQGRKMFDASWATLSTKSKIDVQAAGTKRKIESLNADLIINLNSLSKGFGPSGNKITTSMALSTGIQSINNAVMTGVIKPDAGAELKIKFQEDMSSKAVVGWLNTQPVGSMVDAFKQMNTGNFKDTETAIAWAGLGSEKKRTLLSGQITNISRMNALQAKKEQEEEDTLRKVAKSGMLDFYDVKLNEGLNDAQITARRAKILSELVDNAEMSPTTYKTMLDENNGVNARFDDPNKSTALKIKIFRTPHLVTVGEIVGSGLSNTDELITLLNAKQTGRMGRAKEVIKSSGAFVPANMAEARLKGDAFNAAQADIFSKILEMENDARDAGTPFDPIAKAKDLIKEFVGDPENVAELRESATRYLASLGINRLEDVLAYKTNNPNLTISKKTHIDKQARRAFPQ